MAVDKLQRVLFAPAALPLGQPASEVHGGRRSDPRVALAQAAEHAGFDALVLAGRDALGGPRTGAGSASNLSLATGPGDPFVLLGAAAEATRHLRLGALTRSGERHPGVVAKAVATLDVTSFGRAVHLLAIRSGSSADSREDGVLGDRAAEWELGLPVDVVGEELAVMKAMLSTPAPSFSGMHFQLDKAWNEPRSLRPVPPPLGLFVAPGGGPARQTGAGGFKAAAEALAMAPVLEIAVAGELLVLDLRDALVAGRPDRRDASPTQLATDAANLVSAIRLTLDSAAASSGRLPGSTAILALIGTALPARRAELAAIAAACADAGALGLAMALPPGRLLAREASEPRALAEELGGWAAMLERPAA
ncbi:MAG: hypothetical protein JWM85_1356 [Acidimicrobiaceae bacterium]|nr:hypothetical protein [Acidimicrobiaceae bacterium]